MGRSWSGCNTTAGQRDRDRGRRGCGNPSRIPVGRVARPMPGDQAAVGADISSAPRSFRLLSRGDTVRANCQPIFRAEINEHADDKLQRQPRSLWFLPSGQLPITSAGRQSPNFRAAPRSSGSFGWTRSGSILRKAFATSCGLLVRSVITRSSKPTTVNPCRVRPCAIEAVAAPPANAHMTTRSLPYDTIGSQSPSTKARRSLIRPMAASARSESRQAGSAPATMRSIIVQTASDMARLEPSQRERPPRSERTTETVLRRQSTSTTFQLLPPRTAPRDHRQAQERDWLGARCRGLPVHAVLRTGEVR